MGRFESIEVRPSNFGGGKFATKNIRAVEEGISFRDLAKLACPIKTVQFVVERTGADPRTVKGWMAKRRRGRAPDQALAVVWSEIMRRYR